MLDNLRLTTAIQNVLCGFTPDNDDKQVLRELLKELTSGQTNEVTIG